MKVSSNISDLNKSGLKGALLTLLLAVILFLPAYLFWGTLLFSLITIILDQKEKGRFEFRKIYLLYMLYYVLFAIALFWTSNMEIGLRELEYKMLFVAGPLLFSLIRWTKKDVQVLTLGLNFMLFFALIAALYQYSKCTDIYHGCFMSAENAWSIHPTYMAMYGTFAVSLALFTILNKEKKTGSNGYRVIVVVNFIFVLTSSTYVVMVGSKAGLFSLIITFFCYAVFLLYKKLNAIKFGITLVLIVISVLASIAGLMNLTEFKEAKTKLFQYVNDRELFIEEHRADIRSSIARLKVWDTTIRLIKKHPFGVAPGDVQETLNNRYEENGYVIILSRSLNPHNQYFQTILGLGVIGGIVLLSMFLYLLFVGIRRRNILLLIFSCVILFNALFESVLELQVGVFYFVFISLLLEKCSRTNEFGRVYLK